MNETTTGKTVSSLAVTERKTHRPGGFVGIFSQLFDWNRKFAKKKLFSRKLLPPVRGKQQASKKFGGDEKMPKTLHLIADENSGGFPNMKKNLNRHEMRAPGLVARLMGLESMPNVHRDKHRKGLNSVSCGSREEKCVNGRDGYDREDLNLENGSMKIDTRPQKIRKTGQFEKHAVSKFGSEALQIKNVLLLRSRKHYNNHSKLSSPVKSPRISTSRSCSRTSRLIDVASRILEPGLQSTNRAKCALTYSSLVNYASADDVLMDGAVSSLQDVGIGKSPIGQSSCKNCGNLLDVLDSRQNVEEHPFDYLSSSPNSVDTKSERTRSRSHMLSPDQDSYVVHRQNRDDASFVIEKQDNVQACANTFFDGKPPSQGNFIEQQPRSQQCIPWKDVSSSVFTKPRMQKPNETFRGGDRIPSKTRLNNLQSRRASGATAIKGTKDFVALNRALSSRTCARASTGADSSKINSERSFFGGRDDSLPQLETSARKRRTVSSNLHIEHAGTVSPVSLKQRNARRDVASRKESELKFRSTNRTCIQTRPASQMENANGNKNFDVVSFTFNSPLTQRTSASIETKERRNRGNRNSSQRKIVKNNDDNLGKSTSKKQLPAHGDALGTLLEQKLKELTSQEEDRLTNNGIQPIRSTAIILQELISALTAEQPLSPFGETSTSDLKTLQVEGKMEASVGLSHGGDHLSPGSVLEASFSNDCCNSSSLDDSSGCKTYSNSIDYSCQQPVETDADVLDCATSINDGISCEKAVTRILNYVSTILQRINLDVGGLTGSDLSYARDVIFNAELLFGNTAIRTLHGKENFLICQFLLDELETVAGPIWAYLRSITGFNEWKDDTERRRFLFNCVIDCLDKVYRQYCNYMYKTRNTKALFRMDTQLLTWEIESEIRRCTSLAGWTWEIESEIRRCTSLAGRIPDKIIEWEMSHSLGKWMDFETEVYENGGDIDEEIIQGLVEEVVMDLSECWFISF